MKGPLKYIALLLLLAPATGCKREICESPYSDLIKTMTVTGTSPGLAVAPSSYTYDGQGRLTGQVSGGFTNVCTYAPGLLTITYSGSGWVSPPEPAHCYLNAQGLLLTQYPGDTIYYDNLDEKVLEISPGDTIISVWNNGDMVTQMYHTTGGQSADSFFYYDTPDRRNYGTPYLGKNSAHLFKNDLWSGVTVTYSLDRCGRVTTCFYPNGSANGGGAYTRYTYY